MLEGLLIWFWIVEDDFVFIVEICYSFILGILVFLMERYSWFICLVYILIFKIFVLGDL